MSKIVLYPADGYDFDAADVAAYLAGLTSGVFSSAEDFPVTAADGLKVTVGAGRGWVHPSRFTGYSITKREADTLTLPLADPSLPRIDRIVMRYDAGARAASLQVLQGTASSTPTAPAISRTELIYDLCLAEITRPAGSTAVTTGQITDTRLDEKLCGIVRDGVTGIPTDELLAAAGSATGQAQELAFLPRWETSGIDLPAAYAQRMSEVGKKGYGMFAKHHVFTVENGQLVPVKYPDPQRLSELPGYEKEREKVIANTKALLAGMPANNVLLYGDAGTGKSSAVKAIANEFAPEGLRLVEVKKNQLYQIPDLMDKLAANPLKFILFIDDLSFTANDDNFAALKAILEGSVGGRAKNIAVYATSNRRHLIKETLTDRTGDDIHEADTRQELMSLSARFGLTVTFQRPEKARFETILAELAKQHGIDMPMDQLLVKAEAFASRAGGRSPRVAKQFIEQCEAGVQK